MSAEVDRLAESVKNRGQVSRSAIEALGPNLKLCTSVAGLLRSWRKLLLATWKHSSHLISGDTQSAWQHDKNSQLNVAIERHKRTGS